MRRKSVSRASVCFGNRPRAFPASFFPARPSFSPSGRFLWLNRRFFGWMAGFFASRAVIFLSGRPSWGLRRPAFFPSLHLSSRRAIFEKKLTILLSGAAIFVPERVSFFARPHPGVRGLRHLSYGSGWWSVRPGLGGNGEKAESAGRWGRRRSQGGLVDCGEAAGFALGYNGPPVVSCRLFYPESRRFQGVKSGVLWPSNTST
jgi:hypothetical protein